MNKKLIGATLAVLPLAVGGIVVASAQKGDDKQVQASREVGYICPATGEELPCPNCCPLNSGK